MQASQAIWWQDGVCREEAAHTQRLSPPSRASAVMVRVLSVSAVYWTTQASPEVGPLAQLPYVVLPVEWGPLQTFLIFTTDPTVLPTMLRLPTCQREEHKLNLGFQISGSGLGFRV